MSVSFTVGARSYGISLGKTGDIGGHIRIEEGEKALVVKDLTRETQPQAGLALAR